MRNIPLALIVLTLTNQSCSTEIENTNSRSPLVMTESNVSMDTAQVSFSCEELHDTIIQIINQDGIDISECDEIVEQFEYETMFLEFKKDVEFEHKIKIYSVVESVDGSMGWTEYPILQYLSNGRPKAVSLHKYHYFGFSKIHALNESKGLYLMIGGRDGHGFRDINVAHVFQLSADTVNLEYPAFGNRPYLNFCDGEFSYSTKDKELKFQLEQEAIRENLEEILYWRDRYGEFSSDTNSAILIFNHIKREYWKEREFNLEFDGNGFI
mgnify:CR=1 FL=1